MYPFRVFISYSHDDIGLVESMDALLRNPFGLNPVWDCAVRPGARFGGAIRKQIANAHIFMPLLTPNSRESYWVHQEIGYALGIDVPVVPVALDSVPDEMLSGIQAIRIGPGLSGLEQGLHSVDFETLVLAGQRDLERLGITTEVADFGLDRTRWLVHYANDVARPAKVRQRGIFSSFSLPDAPPGDEAWRLIETPESRRDEPFRISLLAERRILEERAREAGCRLLLYPPGKIARAGPVVHRARLANLKQFLQSMPADKVTVAFGKGRLPGALTLVGDWFGAKALPPKPPSEYRQTIFSHHAPAVLRWLREFDREIDDCLLKAKVAPPDSRDRAVEWIEARLRELQGA